MSAEDPISRVPNLSDEAVAHAHRVEKALEREYDGEDQVPRWVIVVETPPLGRIGVASTGDDNADTMRVLQLGYYAFRAGMRRAGDRLPPNLGDDKGALRQLIERWLNEANPGGLWGPREFEALGELVFDFWERGQK